MRAFLFRYATAIRASYWFLPSLMFSGAVILSFVTLWLDAMWGAEWMEELAVFDLTDVESARAVLGTIAAAMLGVAGVTFSITLVAVTNASSQFGPRLVGNFMRDRGNQVVLGTFISTFIYAVMVLRSVAARTEETAAFVPHISVLLSILLAIASVGVLIFFIHHVPASIDIGTITSSVGRALRSRVDDTFPNAGEEADAPPGLTPERFACAARVLAESTGYVQSVDDKAILAIAEADDLIIRLQFRPGDFVTHGDVLLQAFQAHGPEAVTLGLPQETALRRLFTIGDDKTADQNILFLAEELVEIAARALSPGVNDPFTAMTCIDWLSAALQDSAAIPTPSPFRSGTNGTVRLIAHAIDFEQLIDRALPRLTPYVARDYMTSVHMLHRLAVIGAKIEDPGRKAHLRRHMERFIAAAEEGLPLTTARESFKDAADEARTLLDDEGARLDFVFAQSWYAGSG